MKSAEIRRRFLAYFEARGHAVRPSSPLVPEGDRTLLFTNAGMVQFKGVFLGEEKLPFARAATSQKCVRAGGKHNDLEEVGRTARHHTFFEMLGNFSFGDYFKREAIAYAWEFLTVEMGLDPNRLFVTVHHTDDEAAALWTELAGVAPERVFRLGDKDNFWQMADTGPCGPCSEIHYDLRPQEEWGTIPPTPEFERRGEAGEFLELWNLVFMQFDRDASGEQKPLPAPSIDTGLGLERLAAVMQGVGSNYHTDLFIPLLERVAEVVGRPYEAASEEGVSYRVLADHARAVAFLLGDGVFPSNEGRGYVLRRILRRGVRHAWLLGRREATVVEVAGAVIDGMKEAYPGLAARRENIVRAVRGEEERFMGTIEGGMARLAEVAPRAAAGTSPGPVIPGAEVFKLYDTFGFPPDLTRIVAAERGYGVDMEGFEEALEGQRERSRAVGGQVHAASASAKPLSAVVKPGKAAGQAEGRADGVGGDTGFALAGEMHVVHANQQFVGYDSLNAETDVIGYRAHNGHADLILRDRPFYLEAGGQVSDRGSVVGDGWSMEVTQVLRDGDHVVLRGQPTGDFPGEAVLGAAVTARVDAPTRQDTERNHTGTHLLHATLRSVLGDHVVQRGSLVAPDRLRFDFSHTAPMTRDQIGAVEDMVNEGIWVNHPVRTGIRSRDEAVAAGAMALFGEKYGDEVRVVEIPGVSMELCGGTHVRRTGEIGLFGITSETGVGGGVRRIEALTGRRAFGRLARYRDRVEELAGTVKARPENLERRVGELVARVAALEGLVDDLRRHGSGGADVLAEAEIDAGGRPVRYRGVRMRVGSAGDVRKWGDAFRDSPDAVVAVVAAEMPGGKHSLFAFASDRAIAAGLRADQVVREVAARVGGRGGGRPHMAQAGVGDPEGLEDAVRAGAEVVRELARGASA